MSNDIRWRWHLLALVPGFSSVVLFVLLLLVSLNARHNPQWVADVADVVLWTAIGTPLAAPFFAYVAGRGYVRTNYPGLKSPVPFALMYSVANLALWLAGVIFVGVVAKPFP